MHGYRVRTAALFSQILKLLPYFHRLCVERRDESAFDRTAAKKLPIFKWREPVLAELFHFLSEEAGPGPCAGQLAARRGRTGVAVSTSALPRHVPEAAAWFSSPPLSTTRDVRGHM